MNHPSGQTRRRAGFTLIEMLLAIVIFGIVSSSLYLSMRSGLALYKRSTEGLRQAHEITFFFNRLEEELRNSHYSTKHPFTATSERLEFPSVINEYEQDRATLSYVLIGYTAKRGRIEKKTTFLSQRRDAREEKDILAPYLEKCEFFYPFYDQETETLEWQDKWDSELYKSLPRAVKIKCSFFVSVVDAKKGPRRTVERILYIPDGIWGDADA
jgi:prepilin-type N-terminal cleavage/methylation domain-containing protein